MKAYWVFAIVKNKGYGEPWLLSLASCELSLEKAMEEIEKAKNAFVVLSAWIDTFNEDNVKQTVFHECYVNPFGDIDY